MNHRDGELPVHSQILAGAGAGTCQIIVTTPMELLKIQMQMANKNDLHPTINARQLCLKLLSEKGVVGFYRGISATYTRDVYFSMIFFPLFTYFNNKVKIKNRIQHNCHLRRRHMHVGKVEKCCNAE